MTPRRPSKRVLLGAAGVVVLIVVAVVLAIVLTRSSSGDTSGPTVPQLPQADAVQRLFDGIHQNRNVLGDSSASVTMVEYVDVQSATSRRFQMTSMPQIISRYVRTGKLKVAARPVARLGTESIAGRLTAIAAGQQGKFFNMLHLLFLNQGAKNSGWLTANLVRKAAASIPGFDEPVIFTVLRSGMPDQEAFKLDTEAKSDHVRDMPTILVGKTGGKLRKVRLKSPVDTKSVAAAVAAASD